MRALTALLSRWLGLWLTHRRLGWHLALLAVVLTLPSLTLGRQLDDFAHRMILLRTPEAEVGPLAVFATLPGDLASNQRYVDRGILPWWVTPDFKMVFCRVVSAADLWLDYQLWPDSPVLMHLHSLAVFALLVAAVSALYRRLLGPVSLPWVAGLAALLFAVDEAHAVPVAWIANRNALLATAFGVVALLAHDRWRRDGWRPGAVWSAVTLAFALLSGEIGLGAVAFFAAYALTLEPGGLLRRLRSLVPAGATLLLWLLYYRLGGFGTHGSGMYLDPLSDPVGFAHAAVVRLPLLLLGQWTPVAADVATLVPPRTLWIFALAGAAVTALLAVVGLPLLRRSREARFFALGTLLALVPAAATTASNRLLFFAGIGGAGLVAQLIAGVFTDAPEWRRPLAWRRLAVAVAGALVLFHLILAPLLLPVTTVTIRNLGDPVNLAAATLPAAVAGREVIAVNSPEYLLFVTFLPAVAAAQGGPLPARMRGLVAGPVPVAVARIDDRTLEIRLAGDFFAGPLGRLFRRPDRPFTVGQEVALASMTARIATLREDGQPSVVRFRFAAPLEDPAYCWVVWQSDRFVLWTPPAVGATAELPAPRNVFSLAKP